MLPAMNLEVSRRIGMRARSAKLGNDRFIRDTLPADTCTQQ